MRCAMPERSADPKFRSDWCRNSRINLHKSLCHHCSTHRNFRMHVLPYRVLCIMRKRTGHSAIFFKKIAYPDSTADSTDGVQPQDLRRSSSHGRAVLWRSRATNIRVLVIRTTAGTIAPFPRPSFSSCATPLSVCIAVRCRVRDAAAF